MFTYEEKREQFISSRDGRYTERSIIIKDGSRAVGYISEKLHADGTIFVTDFYYKNTPCDYGYFESWYDGCRKSYLGHCKNVAEGKKLFAEWYAKHSAEANCRQKVRMLPASPEAEFFPTPPALAGRMAKYVNWKEVQTILEPSAGKGDLIDCCLKCAKKRSERYREFWSESVDCMEIDPNLRLILQGMGYRVVGDDFLEAAPFKRYDLIVMNPPFSNGDEHLLKAIHLQERGGQIVCLLNAETIRNPYTFRRQVLAKKLAEYNASIEFVEGAFAHAERKSDVEVAIVYIHIVRSVPESNIIEGLRRAERKAAEDQDPEALVSGNWVEQLVTGYEFEAKAGIALMEEFNGVAPYIMNSTGVYSNPLIQLHVNGHEITHANSETVNDYLRGLRYKFWEKLLNHRELTDKMTSDMRSEYSDRIRELRDYDFSMFNVRRFLLEISAQLTRGVEASIEKLFDELSVKHSWYPECEGNVHYYNGWATNKAHKIGMKVILPINAFYTCWDNKKKLEAREFAGQIADIERAMTYLDKGETTSRIDPHYVARVAEDGQVTTLQFTYFSATFYKKGTCHIKFRPEASRIIDRLNIFAARKRQWLPPDYGKKHYSDLDDESKAVIDEFQGEAAYEEVVRAPENYIIAPESPVPMLTA